jgi:hypothetical protein
MPINPNDILFKSEFDPDSALLSSQVREQEVINNSEALLAIIDGEDARRICTRGNISAIIGKAKSRKTFFISMLCAAILAGELQNKILGKKGIKVTIFDTEQSRWYVQMVLKRILRLSCQSEWNIEVFSLRPYSPQQRVETIDRYFSNNKTDFAVIDGIRDLLSDINSCEQSTEISTQLMKWSELNNCHIMTVLHMNKGDQNARGHLGTEIVNKSETVISVTKERGQNETVVECEYMRGIDFDPFKFEINDNLPYVCQAETYKKIEKIPEF